MLRLILMQNTYRKYKILGKLLADLDGRLQKHIVISVLSFCFSVYIKIV